MASYGVQFGHNMAKSEFFAENVKEQRTSCSKNVY